MMESSLTEIFVVESSFGLNVYFNLIEFDWILFNAFLEKEMN